MRGMALLAAENHRQWFAYLAGLSGGFIEQDPLITWTNGTRNASGEHGKRITVAFPHFSEAEADHGIDGTLRQCLADPTVEQIGWWSLLPAEPPDLSIRLLARGFEEGWQPHWMALDLSRLPASPDIPAAVAVHEVPPGGWPPGDDLPYYDRDAAGVFARAQEHHSPPYTHIGAWSDGRLVGHVVGFYPPERQEIAGIYNCGVAPDWRKCGIGSRLTWEVCRRAAACGARAVVLNATPMGETVYRRLGFVGYGPGQTFWMHRSAIRDAPVPAPVVQTAEAVGRNDTAALEQAADKLRRDELDAALPNGLTLLDLANAFRSRDAARRLLDRGVTPDLTALWSFGWSLEARAALAADPSLVDRRKAPHGATPLHQAAYDDNLAFARFLVSHGADISARDQSFNATPLGWAKHNGSTDVAGYLETRSPPTEGGA